MAIFEVLFSTGLRVSELVSLNRDQMNFETGEFGVIGKGGKEVSAIREELMKKTGRPIQLNIHEEPQAETSAVLLAENIAQQLERRISFRRAMRQVVTRALRSGAKGVKVRCGGRLGGAEIARRETYRVGRVPLHTLRAKIDYGFAEAMTLYGKIGVKVWVYKGEVLPAAKARAKTEEKISSGTSTGENKV